MAAEEGEAVESAALEAQAQLSDSVWLELLYNGLTFDLRGLEPGEANEIPAIESRFDFAEEQSFDELEALQIVPGEHLSSGKASMPVVKGMIALARDIAHHFETVSCVVWPPSNSAIGRRFFDSISTAWLEGGAFPALGLTAFRQSADGAIESNGLDFWVGQELRIEQPLAQDKVAATRLAVRIINQIILVGGISDPERIIGPDRIPMILRPSRNGKFIRVWPE